MIGETGIVRLLNNLISRTQVKKKILQRFHPARVPKSLTAISVTLRV